MTEPIRWDGLNPHEKNAISGRSLVDRYSEKVEERGLTECWPWRASRQRGYGVLKINGREMGNILAHIVAFRLRHGRWPKRRVLHSCDHPLCQNPEHLHEGSHRKNMQEMVARGRWNGPRGDRHYMRRSKAAARRNGLARRRYSWLQVVVLRREGASLGRIARELGISKTHVARICRSAA